MFQDFHLIPTMSALENVAVPLELAGRRDAFESAEQELQAVGLGHRLGRDVAHRNVATLRYQLSYQFPAHTGAPTGNDGKPAREIPHIPLRPAALVQPSRIEGRHDAREPLLNTLP